MRVIAIHVKNKFQKPRKRLMGKKMPRTIAV
jgi:hypothetical protein